MSEVVLSSYEIYSPGTKRFAVDALEGLADHYTNAASILASSGMLEQKGNVFHLPESNPDGIHALSVGLSMWLFIDSAFMGGRVSLTKKIKDNAVEVMMLHGISPDKEKRDHMLKKANYPDPFIELTRSIGEEGERDYLRYGQRWSIYDYCAYLAHEFVEHDGIKRSIDRIADSSPDNHARHEILQNAANAFFIDKAVMSTHLHAKAKQFGFLR